MVGLTNAINDHIMITRNTFIIGLITIGLFSCSETTGSVEKNIGRSNESDTNEESVEKEAPKVISFTNESTFTIIKKDGEINELTEGPTVDIFVNNKLLNSPIKIANELNYIEVDLGTKGVPENAVFAYSTWYAGGGVVYYGIVKDGILQINHKYEDEQMEEEEQFTLYREIDPNVQTKDPDYYITYDSDNRSSKQLMIAFSQNGKALFAKYSGQLRQLALKFVKDESEGRNIIEYYDEIVNGEVNGTYRLSHSGNWDNAEYTVKKTGKKFDFTINHEVTIVYDRYRTEPSL